MATIAAAIAPAANEGRDRVLRHARDLFVERGYDGVSMQQIAVATGMTKAALYYHFRDKEELFGQVVRRELDRAKLVLGGVLEQEGSLRDHLEGVAVASFGWFRSDFGRLMGDLKHHVSEARRQAIGCDSRVPFDTVRPRFARAVAEGELRADLDVDLVVSLFFGLLWSQMQQARLDEAAPGEELASAVVEVLLCGIAARPCEPGATAASATS